MCRRGRAWAFGCSLFIRHPTVTTRCFYLRRREKSECLCHVCNSIHNPIKTNIIHFMPSLQTRQEFEWYSKVKLLLGDMRSLEIPEKADILVTELLGSFGDNELSPECLDGAVRFLKRECNFCQITIAAEILFQPMVFQYHHHTRPIWRHYLRPSYTTKPGPERTIRAWKLHMW